MVDIYLCDDVPELRQLLRVILEEDPGLRVVGETGDARVGIEEIAELQPNVVLLDLSMPGMDGLEALPLIRRAAPGTSVIVFSGFTESRMAGLVLENGAARYIEKGEPLERVREAVRELAISR
ncbi:MAG TPA: response regulator transcription factor [Thermoanaerobaculia bacterium]